MDNPQTIWLHKNKVLLLIFLISAAFVMLFSYSTSIFYPNYYGSSYGGDAAQFLTIGKAWAEGKIPYKEMFDHKGPIIFFIDMLGFLFFGSKSGIMIFQIVFIFATCIFLYKIAMLSGKKSPQYGIIAIVVSLIVLKASYCNGNSVEEYCLPFITVSVYFQVEFLSQYSSGSKKQITHNPWIAFFYGLTFAVGFLTRLTNVLPICLGVLEITVLLILHKQFQNLLQNIAGFLAGFFVLFLPFLIYFAVHGAAFDFLYAAIGFNIEYSAAMSSWLRSATSDKVISFFKEYGAFFACAFSIPLTFRRRKYTLTVLYILWFLSEGYLFGSGQSFVQYAIITIPQVVLLLNEIMLLDNSEHLSLSKVIAVCMVSIFCYNSVLQYFPVALDIYQKSKKAEVREYQPLIDMIPENEKSSFVAYGGNDFKDLYLIEDLMPCYKYFVIQDWHAKFSDSIKQDIHEVYANGNAQWILTQDGSTTVIQDVLDEDYVQVASAGEYRLWNRKQ